MKIMLAGPIETLALADATGIDLSGLPVATTQTPLAPLAAGLIEAGHEVHVLTTDPYLDRTQDYRRGPLTMTFCPLRGAPRYRARTRSLDLFRFEIACLTAAMRNAPVDLIHAHWTYEFAEAAIRAGRPMIVTMHDIGWSVLREFRDLYRTMRLIMKYRAMVRVPALTVVAPFMARKAWHYGYFGPIDVVPNPVSYSPMVPKSLDRPVIVTIGNGGPSKNVTASVAAFARIREKLPTAELHLFGPDLGPEGIFADCGPNVTCHGNVPHGTLMRFLSEHARVLLHPSRAETFGVILAEARMRGVPIVAGRDSNVDFVFDNVGGTLVDINNPDAIAEAALQILTRPSDYPDLQRAAHENTVARFSLEGVTARYLEIYDRVLARR